jgi:tRNA-binding protein
MMASQVQNDFNRFLYHINWRTIYVTVKSFFKRSYLMATIDDFLKLDLRVGTVVEAEPFPEARIPAIKMKIDFGDFGMKRSSAQITKRYAPESIVGRQVVAVVNFPPRRIAGFESEVLVLGGVPEKGDVILLQPDGDVPNGTPIA